MHQIGCCILCRKPIASAVDSRLCARRRAIQCGDDDYASTGPSGWRSADRALAWAHAVVVHGAAADVETYHVAIEAAERTGRALLIETDAAHLAEWIARVPAQAAALAVMPEGGAHPIVPPKDLLQ